MPRQKRSDEAGVIYHALNRGNDRKTIFEKPADYEAFIRILDEGLQKYSVELFAFTLMPNHWHFVLRPGKDGQMGRLLRWVSATHTLRYHGHYRRHGYGHLYQSRFKSFPVQDDEHFYVLCRYVERNPLRANLVAAAEQRGKGPPIIVAGGTRRTNSDLSDQPDAFLVHRLPRRICSDFRPENLYRRSIQPG